LLVVAAAKVWVNQHLKCPAWLLQSVGVNRSTVKQAQIMGTDRRTAQRNLATVLNLGDRKVLVAVSIS